MIDFEILDKKYGTNQARLKAVCTARKPENFDKLSKEEKEACERDIERRKKLEELIQFRLYDGMTFGLRNHQLYAAVDASWDSTPILKSTIPLMLFAQGKLNLGQCATSLEAAGFGKYVTKNERGIPQSIDMPRFYETNVNLIRSIFTRRLAAQSNKYSNLWPFYKFEPRSTALTAKLKADALSQKVDIMVDNYDLRHHEVQVIRETLMYAHVVDFVRCGWEKEQQVRRIAQAPGLETSDLQTEVVTTKEGVCFVNPHPSRTFWDMAHPLISLNTDTGCEWIGYWDVKRYRDIHGNPTYWNRDNISYSSNVVGLFATYSNFFTQYYCTISPPDMTSSPDFTSWNDRKNNIGIYSGDQGDSAVIFATFCWKLKPSDWGLGDYPYPVWYRLIVGGDNTILHGEILPSTPGAVCSHNENDSRQVNISFAHELMGYQDQLTNLLSYLLLCLQADNIKVVVVDTDLATKEQITAFREQLKGSNAYTGTTVLEISRSKLESLGITDPSKVVQLIETRSSQLDVIFRAIGQLIQMVERMAALSPQEQGQPAPREISATETNLIAGTTESVYGFISDSIDEYRAAKKRIIYESYMAMGDQNFTVPVINRYPRSVIEAAGFRVGEGESAPDGPIERAERFTITGTKDRLEHDYIFTSRDGAERPVNTQSAAVMVQLLQSVLSIPPVLQALKKDQLFEIVNEIFRQSGAGYDLKLELQPGEENTMGPDPNQIIAEFQGVLDGLTKASENNKVEIEQIKQLLEPILRMIPQQPQQGVPQGPIPMAA